jgi:predicted phage tail protein
MFDAQITVALFAAFLLGMVAGSGIEIIVGGVAALDPRSRGARQTSKGRQRSCWEKTQAEAEGGKPGK